MRTPRRLPLWIIFFLAALAPAVAGNVARAQFGTVLSGAGPVNRSMGGVSTAAPLSVSGAMFWNPATIAGFGRSEFEASAELFFPHTRLTSQANPNAFGPGVPSLPLAGATDTDVGAYPIPTIGLAYLPEGSPLSFGLGVFAMAGFGLDYAGSATNPLLTPPPPNGVGFGPLNSEFLMLQIAPAVAYRLTDRLAVAAGPTLNLARLRIDPAVIAAPDNANGDAFATYPPGSHSQLTYGGGFVVGLYYQADTWAVGASVKSPQWFDSFRINARDELGRPRSLRFGLDLPLIVSLGAAYAGWERWMLAADVRYLDYRNANGFKERGFDPDGAARGLGWKSVFAAAAGAQYQLTDALTLRAGYSWGDSPVDDSRTMFSVLAPTVIEHMLSAGASWKVTEDFTLSVAYVRGFENSHEGPVVTPGGPVPGTAVRISTSADMVVFGAGVKFGGPGSCGTATRCEPRIGER